MGGFVLHISTRNADKYKAETCVNQIYWELSNFIYAASSSKIFNSDSKTPEKYLINMTKEEWKETIKTITLSINNNETQYKNINLSTIENCNKPLQYSVKTQSTFTWATLLPWLKSLGNTPWLILEKNQFTWTIAFQFCQNKNNISGCEDFAKINLDARTGLLTKSFCQLYNEDNSTTTDKDKWTTCKQRSL